MKKDVAQLLSSALLLLSVCCASAYAQEYTPQWSSLEKHTAVPDWMRDAKFGIYCHWGVYSVPAYANEQYFHYMHCDSEEDHGLMNTHLRQVELYGPLSEFGYHDFIPMFRAELFDADAWAQLFKESGARFAGIVGEHHDGFAMWDSQFTPFNAKAMGPERDVVGELEKAIKARGMKFFVSLHHEINYTYVKVKPEWAANNPKYAKLYGCLMPHDEWLQMWLDKCNEVVDKYSPDIVYFDAWMDQIPEPYKLDFVAHYLNHAQTTGQEVILTYKEEDFPRSVGMLDHEMFSPNEIDSIPWLCDYTISTGYHRAWGYVKGMQVCTSREIVHKLVEVVSNNGQLLLNLSPMADGTFPQDQRDVVANVGVWLWSYGEAIYGTRPFKRSGEVIDGRWRVHYTQRGKQVYAILLDWPGTGKPLCLKAMCNENLGGEIESATLLSVKHDYPCSFEPGENGLTLTIPEGARLPSDAASVVRFTLK